MIPPTEGFAFAVTPLIPSLYEARYAGLAGLLRCVLQGSRPENLGNSMAAWNNIVEEIELGRTQP